MRQIHYIFLILLTGYQLACEPGRKPVLKEGINTAGSPTLQDSVAGDKSGVSTADKTLKNPDNTDFKEAFSNFHLAILNQDSVALQKFIDPVRGVYIIEVPGAVPHFTKLNYISGFKRSYLNRPFFSIREDLKETSVLEEGLPKHSCDKISKTRSGYEKEGLFVGSPQGFIKSTMWKNTDLNKTSKQNIEKVVPFLSRTVIHTASSFKFHFGQVNGQWKIFFIDLSVPCSA